MKNCVKDLTEGMQRLCDIANRIVAADGKVGLIERDLLMDDLRRLYDVALQLCPDAVTVQSPASVAKEPETPVEEPMPDEEILSSTMMATMAAMAAAPAEPEPEPVVEPEPEPEPEPETLPEPEPEPEGIRDREWPAVRRGSGGARAGTRARGRSRAGNGV